MTNITCAGHFYRIILDTLHNTEALLIVCAESSGCTNEKTYEYFKRILCSMHSKLSRDGNITERLSYLRFIWYNVCYECNHSFERSGYVQISNRDRTG